MQPTGEWLNRPGGLAERLQRLRKAAGLTGEHMAEQLGWPRTKISKLENGRQMPSMEDIAAWARAVGHPEAVEELLTLLDEAQAVHRQYRHQIRRGHAAIQADMDKLVRQAKRFRNVDLLVVPGLLQTAEYARYRALEAVRNYGFDADGVEATVAARMRRQDVLYEPGRSFEFVITEGALTFWAAPPQVMLGQVDRLMSVAGLENVTLAIVPMYSQMHTLPMHGFLILDDSVYAELHGGEDFPPGGELAQYERIADGLLDEAVSGQQARDLLMAAAGRLRVAGY